MKYSFCLLVAAGFWSGASVEAQTHNAWTSSTSGNWENASNWSLGIRPASNQTISIDNAGYKAVGISSSTVSGFPDSMTVSNLSISAPNGALSVLLLNYAGTSVPLHVLDVCSIGANGSLQNYYSSLQVDGSNGVYYGGSFVFGDGAQFIQEGGLTVITPTVELGNGTLNATNATMNLGALNVGDDFNGTPGNVSQSGGTVLSGVLTIDIGNYTLQDAGTLYVLDTTTLRGSSASFNQISGTNYGNVHQNAGYYHFYDGLMRGNDLSTAGSGGFVQYGGTAEFATVEVQGANSYTLSYTLNGGNLHCGNLNLTGLLQDWGGTLTLTNGLSLGTGRLELQGGTASMPWMVVSNSGSCIQYSGTNQIAGDFALYNRQFVVWSGLFSSVNLGVAGGALFIQYGGSTEVSGVLSSVGDYYLNGGVLSVGGMYLRGTLSLNQGGNPPASFLNSGLINFGGTLNIAASQNSMGQLGLSTNGTINLAASPLVVHFADSSPLNWDANSRLVIAGWNGSYYGNGSHQVFFGSSATGLTSSQLAQIQFSNPAGYPSANYPAQLLSTGELVPATAPPSPPPQFVNSWTNPASGNWEDLKWSLGILPASNQTIMLTNQASKTVAISSNTVKNFPQTLSVDSITVSSPPSSFNELLLNDASYQTALTANAITLGSNTVMTILASALNVTNTANTNYCLEVGGTINQGEFPAVNVNLLRIGDIGPGIYNLTNGTLTVGTGYVGGAFTGQFNQYGGYNWASMLTVSGPRGEYDLYDGSLGGMVALDNGALLRQSGGIFAGNLSLDGTYELDNGSFTTTNLLIPATEYGYTGNHNAGEVLQTGGTNQTGEIYLGGVGEGYDPYQWAVPGSYVLSNGLLLATSIDIDVGGTVTQTGGTFTNSGPLELGADLLHLDTGLAFFCGQYVLQGGFLAEDSIDSSGYFTQSGGTNQVAGSTHIGSIETEGMGDNQAQYTLSGGSFTTAGVTVSNAIFSQSAGSLITGNLALSDSIVHNPFRALSGYFFGGGQLSVSALQVAGYAVFRHQGGTLLEPGLLTLAGGLWDEQTAGQKFGALQLASADNRTNSTLSLPANSCIMHFADSSAVAWESGVTLSITNWAGATQGGGKHQIVFGSNSSALTTPQLSDIIFANPAGLPTGMYPARILSSGEIVPNTGPSPVASAPVREANGTMDVLVNGVMGKVYGMDVSTDLVHWVSLSTQTNQSGTMTFKDTAAPNYPYRFYRAYIQQ